MPDPNWTSGRCPSTVSSRGRRGASPPLGASIHGPMVLGRTSPPRSTPPPPIPAGPSHWGSIPRGWSPSRPPNTVPRGSWSAGIHRIPPCRTLSCRLRRVPRSGRTATGIPTTSTRSLSSREITCTSSPEGDTPDPCRTPRSTATTVSRARRSGISIIRRGRDTRRPRASSREGTTSCRPRTGTSTGSR